LQRRHSPVKKRCLVILLIFASFFLYAVYRKKFTLPPDWKYDLILGAFIVLVIMSVLYSAFGAHIETLTGQNFAVNTSGWYKAVEHWAAMHNQQRLGGPLYFYIPFYLLYELPIFILAIIGTLQLLGNGLNPALSIRLKNRIIITGPESQLQNSPKSAGSS
jgi:predicted membrane-bound mannosyltransferase